VLNAAVVGNCDARSSSGRSQAGVTLVLRCGSSSDASTTSRVDNAGSAVVVTELSAGEARSNAVLSIGELAERTGDRASDIDVEAAVG